MEYLNNINEALDYIENNLNGRIDNNIVSKKACCSFNCFQRMFSYITGIRLSEYIRRRRMTLAALEIQQSNIKIIDLALKYGYESQDSFSRAFKSIHGLLPLKIQNNDLTIKAYPRINFLISIKGDIEMNYRIEKKEPFKIVGVKKNYQAPNDNENSVGEFWNEIYENGIHEKLSALCNSKPKGVHGFIQILGEDRVDYIIACVTNKKPLKGMTSFTVPELTWAIFEFIGPVNTTMSKAWKRIFAEWLPTSGYKYQEKIDIECFPFGTDKKSVDCKFEIWIPVTK